MTTAHDGDPRVAAAREAVAAMQRRVLAEGPLGRMAEWVATGRPPPAAELRALGLTTEGPPGQTPEAALRRHELTQARKAFTVQWGFSIPCAEAVQALLALGPLVEVGAGTGYWTAILRAAGAEVAATDLHPRGRNSYGFEGGAHAHIEALGAVEAVRRYADRAVFCSWPSEGESWALGMTWAMRPGQRLAIILNPRNTGSRGLFRYLATRFRELGSVEIPQFPVAADKLTIFEKR